jgi:hypothetical protein
VLVALIKISAQQTMKLRLLEIGTTRLPSHHRSRLISALIREGERQ